MNKYTTLILITTFMGCSGHCNTNCSSRSIPSEEVDAGELPSTSSESSRLYKQSIQAHEVIIYANETD